MKKTLPVEFVKGIPAGLEDDDFVDPKVNNLIVLDDLMVDAGKDERVAKLYIDGSSRDNLSVVSIMHNLFHQGKAMRDISLNADYLVLFKNPRDQAQVADLVAQMFRREKKDEKEAFLRRYDRIMEERARAYAVIDLKGEEVRLRSDLFREKLSSSLPRSPPVEDPGRAVGEAPMEGKAPTKPLTPPPPTTPTSDRKSTRLNSSH